MKSQWIVVAAAMMIVFPGALRTAAQGPQGAGAETTTHSSHAPRSYNPLKWMKKDSKTATAKPKKDKNKKPAEKSATPEAPLPPWKFEHPGNIGYKS